MKLKLFNFNQWNDPTDFERNELVFEKRNKSYGAYAIRTNYNRTMIRALVCTVFFMVGLFMIPKINQLWAKDTIEPIWIGREVDFTPKEDEKVEEEKVEEKEKQVEKTKDIKSVNPWKEIKDIITEIDTLTIDDINKLTISNIHNPNGTDSTDNLFVDIEDIDSGNTIVIEKKDEAVIYVEEMPEFIGGNDNLPPYLGGNIKYPQDAVEDGKEAHVIVGFIVEKDGSISNIKILKCNEKGYGFEKEAIRVISNMPRWKPGRQNGHPARVFFNIPLNFRLM